MIPAKEEVNRATFVTLIELQQPGHYFFDDNKISHGCGRASLALDPADPAEGTPENIGHIIFSELREFFVKFFTIHIIHGEEFVEKVDTVQVRLVSDCGDSQI